MTKCWCGKELEAAYQGPADNPSPFGVWVCPDPKHGADCVWRECAFASDVPPRELPTGWVR